MIYDIYVAPNFKNQFEFTEVIKKKLHEPIAFDIDKMENWQVCLIIDLASQDDLLKRFTLCSRYHGKLYSIGAMFQRARLWYLDSTDSVDDVNFLTISRY